MTLKNDWVDENTPGHTSEDWTFTAADANAVADAVNTNTTDKYELPGTGIPATDLSSGVQDSLAAADAAQPLIKAGQPVISGGAQLAGIPGVLFSGAVTTIANAANTVVYVPFTVRYPLTITNLIFEVTQGPIADAGAHVGIYAADSSWQPSGGPLTDQTVSVATSFTGVKSVSGLSVALTAGNHLVAVNTSFQMALRVVRGLSPAVSATLTANPVWGNGYVAQTYGALPTPGTAWTAADLSGNGIYHTVFFKWTE